MFLFLKKKILNLHDRYIPALTLIVIFSTLAFLNVQDIMNSIKNDGKLINISGRQRMYSQNVVLITHQYITTRDPKIYKNLENTINLMRNEHQYLLEKALSPALKKIYYDENLNLDIANFFISISKLIKNNDINAFEILQKSSQIILDKLDKVVEIYEQEHTNKLLTLQNREKYLYFLTLLALLLEAILIFYPASKKIKHIEKELHVKLESKTKELEYSFEFINEHVIYSETNLTGFITYASQAFCEISGYTSEELIGKPHNIIRHPDMPKDAFEEMWKNIKSGKQWSGEVKNLKKNGDYYWVIAHISPKYDQSNNLVGYSGVRHDITDKKALDELTQNLTKKVKEEVDKNREKEQKLYSQEKMTQMMEMIGNIAHHWRQPLSVISTAASGMQVHKEYGILTDSLFENAMQSILAQAENLSETIEKFTKYIDLQDTNSSFFLSNHLKETLDIVNFTLVNFNIKLVVNIEHNNKEIFSNKENLSQVILNLIYNARDMLVERKIQNPEINVSLEQQNNNSIITIEDNAGGIENEYIHKIFDPYFTTKHKSVGTGLGLTMCYSIITTKLNGKISVSNSLKGAKFIMSLPIVYK